MNRYLSLLKREFRLFTSNKIMMILYLGGPVLYGLIFGLVYSQGKLTDLPVIVVDKDHSPTSARLIDMLDQSDVLKVKEVRPGTEGLDKIFMVDSVYAAVVIPYRFEADLLQDRHPELNTYIDNTNLLASGYVGRSLTAVAATLDAMTSAARGKKTAAFRQNTLQQSPLRQNTLQQSPLRQNTLQQSPLRQNTFRLNTFRLFNPASNYFLFIWPSYLAIVLQSVVMVVLALSFASEFEQGKLLSLYRDSGSSVLLMLFAKVSLYWLLSIVALTIYAIYFHFLHQPYPTHAGQLLVICSLFIAANSMLGMSAGLLLKAQLKALQFLMILSLPVYISSGFSWPFDQDGWVARIVGYVFPFMSFVNGFRILLIEHGALADIKDYILLQALQLGLYFSLGLLLLKWQVRKQLAV